MDARSALEAVEAIRAAVPDDERGQFDRDLLGRQLRVVGEAMGTLVVAEGGVDGHNTDRNDQMIDIELENANPLSLSPISKNHLGLLAVMAGGFFVEGAEGRILSSAEMADRLNLSDKSPRQDGESERDYRLRLQATVDARVSRLRARVAEIIGQPITAIKGREGIVSAILENNLVRVKTFELT